MTRFSAVRGAWGVLLLSAPGGIVRLCSGRRPGRVDITVARVLGARQLIQATACAGLPGRVVLLLGAEADGAHTVTSLALAVCNRPRRRGALVDAVIAATFAATGLVAAGRCPAGASSAGRHRLAAGLDVLRQRTAAALARTTLPAGAQRWAGMVGSAR